MFILLGGPGDAVSAERINREVRYRHFTLGRRVADLSKTRDVVIMNQRGNSDAPGFHGHDMIIMGKPDPTNQPFSIRDASKRLREGTKSTFDRWTKLGYDLAGYDIINLVDDVEAIRKAF